MSNKTSMQVNESNRLRAATNTYNNTVVPKVNDLLAGYGVTEPLTLAQIEGLTLKQLGAILRDISPMLGAIGMEISDRKLEDNLAAAGYTSVAEATADIPNHLTGDAAIHATAVFTHTINNLAILEGLVDAGLMFTLLSKVVDIKNAIVNTAGEMTQI
ncbi:MAG: hypothetical protein JRE23_00190 [Deltaproteobacteria bacterium]|nr:hypothetical protein [Deltaproteobacteria bacterium]